MTVVKQDLKTEALKLALEALEECRRDPRLKYEHPYYDKTITAIRESLAEQQPCHSKTGESETQSNLTLTGETKAQHQEPVAYASDVEFDDETEIIPAEQKGKLGTAGLRIPLYIDPPASKPWVPLTEFDIDQIPYSCSHADSRLIAFAIEAKLREKNA